MLDGYYIGRYRGEYCAKLFVDGKRVSRHTLGTNQQAEAERRIKQLNDERARASLPAHLTVDHLMDLYIADRKLEKKVAVGRMVQCRAVLKPCFGAYMPEQIDKTMCMNYIEARRNINVGDATIRTELAYLSAAMQYGVDMKHISNKPKIWRPPQARPRSAVEDYHLTRPQAARLLDEAIGIPHLWLWITLALGTAGRPSHILELTWDRVNFHQGWVNLDNPRKERTAKGRARVAMNESVRDALQEARRHATTPFVIEWNGRPLKSIKGALKRAADRAGLEASPYVLRHTSAVWMAESGVALEEIGQIMGHTSPSITYRVYARFSPHHQKGAVASLQVVRGSTGSREPQNQNGAGTSGAAL